MRKKKYIQNHECEYEYENEYDIKLNFSTNNLLPGPKLEGRINYVDFLYSLYEISQVKYDKYDKDKYIDNVIDNYKNLIIDIGTGSSCIYPIVGIKIEKYNKIFDFIGIDISKDSINQANENIKLNNIDSNRIKLIHLLKDSTLLQNDLLNYTNTNDNNFKNMINSLNNGPLLQLKSQDEDMIADDRSEIFACMCNPPFFNSNNDLHQHLHKKFKANNSNNGDNNNDNNNGKILGQKNELITIGGDFIFATTILIDSLRLTTKIKWYTCLLGSKISFIKFYQLLLKQDIDINNILCTSFKPDRIIRWCIAWTFHNLNHLKQIKPLKYDYDYVISRGLKREKLNKIIENDGTYYKSFIINEESLFQTILSDEQQFINEDCNNKNILLNRILGCSNLHHHHHNNNNNNSINNNNTEIFMKKIDNNLIECDNRNILFDIIIKEADTESKKGKEKDNTFFEVVLKSKLNDNNMVTIKDEQYHKITFNNLYNYLFCNITRTNRKWRRKLKSKKI